SAWWSSPGSTSSSSTGSTEAERTRETAQARAADQHALPRVDRVRHPRTTGSVRPRVAAAGRIARQRSPVARDPALGELRTRVDGRELLAPHPQQLPDPA